MKFKRVNMFQFEEVCSKPIICFGVSKHIDTFCRKLGNDLWKNRIKAFVDNNISIQGTYLEIYDKKVPVYGIEYLCGCKDVSLLITVAGRSKVLEIVEQLSTLNIDDSVDCYCLIRIEAESFYDDSAIINAESDGSDKIEKIIHSFWFSKEPKAKEYQECIDSWKKYCPGYKILEWNTDNYDIGKNKYMKQAFEKKKWALVSDYARLDVVHEYGGIYLDMDVELLKEPKELIKHNAFFSIDLEGYIDLGSGFGARKGLPLLEKLLHVYDNLEFSEIEKWGNWQGLVAQPQRLLTHFESIGYKKNTDSQNIDDMLFLSPNYFRVIEDHTHQLRDFAGTEYGIHWHNGGWKDAEWLEERAKREKEKRKNFRVYDDLCIETGRNEPVVSIILPVYNSAKYLEATLQSIFGQVYRNFELIIIDDNSQDGSIAIIDKIKDERVKVIKHKENVGVSKTRNEGIDNAVGEYILFMDHDDLLPGDRLLKHVMYLDNNDEIGAVGGKIMNIDSSGEIVGVYREEIESDPKVNRAILHTENPYINGSVTYRSEVIHKNEIRFWHNAYGLEDYVFLLAVSKVAEISCIEDVTLYYRRHESNAEKYILKNQFREREEKWKDVYEYSFKADGLKLSREYTDILCRVFVKEREKKLSLEDCSNVLLVFHAIKEQLIDIPEENRDALLIWMRLNIEEICEIAKWSI